MTAKKYPHDGDPGPASGGDGARSPARAEADGEPELGWAIARTHSRELVQEVVHRTRERASTAGAELVVQCADCAVRVDPTAFVGFLCELVDSAFETTRRGGTVLLDVVETEDGRVLWQMRDAGGPRHRPAAWLHYAWLTTALSWELARYDARFRIDSAPEGPCTLSVWLPADRTTTG